VRGDPFVADADGAFHGFQRIGQDAFANRNIPSIALEVPSDMLGWEPEIGVWATVSVRRDGLLVQVDRGGHPTINPFINPNDAKDDYNASQPCDDEAKCLGASRSHWKTTGTRPMRPGRSPSPCCPTSSASTTGGQPPTRMAAPCPMTSSAPASPG
jgi:hypothetical protein